MKKPTFKLAASSAAAFLLLGAAGTGYAYAQEQPSTVAAAVYEQAASSASSSSGGVAVTAPALPAPDVSSPALPAPPLLGEPPLGPIGPGLELDKDTLLSLLNISESGLRTALEGGQSLLAVAQAQGADVGQLTALAAKSIIAHLDRELQNGHITQDQYNARVNEATGRAEARLARPRPQPPVPGSEQPPIGHGMEKLDTTALTGLLGMSTDELRTTMEAGSSLEEIASEKGVASSQLLELAVSGLQAELNQRLADKEIWQDEYAAQTADVTARALDLIQHKHVHPAAPALLK
jgi:hypothetical protein